MAVLYLSLHAHLPCKLAVPSAAWDFTTATQKRKRGVHVNPALSHLRSPLYTAERPRFPSFPCTSRLPRNSSAPAALARIQGDANLGSCSIRAAR
jgi:hypothetical protein